MRSGKKNFTQYQKEDVIFSLQVAWVKLLDMVVEEISSEIKGELLCYLDEGWIEKNTYNPDRTITAIKKFEQAIKNQKISHTISQTLNEIKSIFTEIHNTA